MFRWLVVLLGCFIATQTIAADDNSRVLGVWKLVAYDLEFQDTGERRPVFGKKPVGYIIFTSEGRMTAYLEAENRKSPETDSERAAAFRTMIAYSGKYRLEVTSGLQRLTPHGMWPGSVLTKNASLNSTANNCTSFPSGFEAPPMTIGWSALI